MTIVSQDGSKGINMKVWALVFRVKEKAAAGLMPRGLQRDADAALRIKASYAASLSGVKLVGFEVLVEEEEFPQVIRVIRVLEKDHNLSLFEFSARSEAAADGAFSIKIGSKPTINVA